MLFDQYINSFFEKNSKYAKFKTAGTYKALLIAIEISQISPVVLANITIEPKRKIKKNKIVLVFHFILLYQKVTTN